MRARKPGGRGFTLVEVLVALMVMSLLSMMAWSGLNGLLKSRDIAQAHLDRSARLQTVLAQWETDLRAVQDSGQAPALAFDGAQLRLTRQQPNGLQVISWTLREGGLYRWESPLLQDMAALAQAYERGAQGQTLAQDRQQLRMLDGISGWQLYFYRGNGWSNAQSSDDVAAAPPSPPSPASSDAGVGPATGPKRPVLPSGVRMILQFAPESGFNGSLTRQIMVGAQS